MSVNKPKLQEHIQIEETQNGRRVVHNPASEGYFQLGESEANFIESLDGTLSLEELQLEHDLLFSADEISYLITWSKEQGLLVGSEAPVKIERPSSMSAKIVKFFTQPGSWRKQLINPDPILNRYRHIVDGFFSKPALLAYLLIFLSPVITFMLFPEQAIAQFKQTDLSIGSLPVSGWILVYFLTFLTVILHELAHAVSCKHYGGKVPRIGMMMLYLHPIIYCDVTDIWRLRSKQQKVLVMVAGIFLQFLFSAIAFTAFMFSGEKVLLFYAATNTAIAMFNFFPLVKLDGYWMLSHAIGEPNLMNKSVETVKNSIRKLFVPQKPDSKPTDSSPNKNKNKNKNKFMLMGVGHLLATPLFTLLGLFTIYRYASKIDVYLAILMTISFGLPVAIKLISGIGDFIAVLQQERRQQSA